MTEPTDRQLWAQVAADDSEAFGVVFDRHARPIYNFCFRRCGSWTDAEDLMSIVFLEAWRRRDVGLEADTVLPWLYGIATNVTRNYQRTLRRHRRALNRLSPDVVQADPADHVAERLDDEAAVGRVLTALSNIPSLERDVLALVVWADLTYQQTADALGIPIGTVRSRLNRARSRLGLEIQTNPTRAEGTA